ncbi:LPS-assembly protein LptD [Chromobacterium phragmitis]|uniref:LPS-assembly protein LptD n=1 Tax=Chromobacterium phragmitis TaxID=2202141 RepID=A0A344UK39_9NEIS|nr:LPS-assembly protein LptD [Chromobacterium phragmitis]AXE30243.1 LPS-assembly protein LptD [Chromobacterium phragmitis]AXE35637.1 LPS-assembly protein LptD [Chromobacterium phragmitis]
MHRQKLNPLALAIAAAFALNAPAAFADEEQPIAIPAPPKEPGQTLVHADDVDGEMNVILHAKGNVVVTRDDQKVESDWLDYYQTKNQVKAGDRFRMTRGEDVISGTTLDYNVDTYSGTGMNPVFSMARQNQTAPKPASGGLPAKPVTLHGDGSQVDFQGQNQYRVYGSRMTTCDPGDEAWYLKSSRTDLDYNTGVGVARNAWMQFYGVPILYSPWLDFPLNSNRKSGFLMPTFKTGSSGTEFSLPYYWNIAPNYDATITPHINVKHGNMLAGEFRYLQPGYGGRIYTEQLPKDKLTGESRNAWSIAHSQNFGNGWSFGLDYNSVSDRNYFKDFGDQVAIASNVNLTQEASLNYATGWSGGSATTTLRVQHYQNLTINPSSEDIPYARMPQLTLNANQSLPAGFSANLLADLTRFDHPSLQTGDRFVLYPSLSWNFDRSWGFIRPKIGVNFTEYNLDAYGSSPQGTRTRTLPIFSTDAGLYFDRDTQFMGRDHLMTLEPRLFYVNIPNNSDQLSLPMFDTSVNDLNFAQLFNENRFSGYDRINGANQVTTALTSRFIDQSNGLERLRLAIGKRFYMKDDVTQTANQPSSDLLLAAGGDLTRDWRFDSSYQYNQQLGLTERYNAQLRYNPAAGKVASVRYRYGRNEQLLDNASITGPLRQVDVAAQWPIARRWYAIGRYNYSLIERKPIERLAGFEYNDGCWSLRMYNQRYVSDPTTTKNAWFFQLELRGLGALGNSGVESTLRLAVPGYTKTNQ